jgi:hypothetical protein
MRNFARERLMAVYMVACRFGEKVQPTYNAFLSLLNDWRAHPILKEALWIVEADRTATELYLDLQRYIRPDHDMALVAQITANSCGTYIANSDSKVAGFLARAMWPPNNQFSVRPLDESRLAPAEGPVAE